MNREQLQRLRAALAAAAPPPPGVQHWLQEGRQGSRGQWWQFGNHDGAPNPKGTGPFRRKPKRRGLRAGETELPYYGRPNQRN